jgi:hypothetical protein
MKKWVTILLIFFLTGANSCNPKIKCDCSNNNVCISFTNSSGQPLQTLSLLSHGVNKTTIQQLALNDKPCLSFNSSGENTFSLTAILKNGKPIKSSEVYCEGGYKFTATATESEIKIVYSNSY